MYGITPSQARLAAAGAALKTRHFPSFGKTGEKKTRKVIAIQRSNAGVLFGKGTVWTKFWLTTFFPFFPLKTCGYNFDRATKLINQVREGVCTVSLIVPRETARDLGNYEGGRERVGEALPAGSMSLEREAAREREAGRGEEINGIGRGFREKDELLDR